MIKVTCLHCMWEGEEEQLVEVFAPNENNPEDHTLYPTIACPQCGEEHSLTFDFEEETAHIRLQNLTDEKIDNDETNI